MIPTSQASNLADLLEARGDPMAACSARWLRHLRKTPVNAAVPLAMSGPHPRAVGSYGAEATAWAKAELGVTYRWWQELAITRQLEHDADGALVWREIVETGPRRIGKSTRLRGTALWRTSNAERIGETQLSMLVSKDLAVGKEIHRPSWRYAERKGWKVTKLNGAQEIEAPGEHRWLLRAPNAAYGYDVGYGQVDESWGVDPQAITDGLEPALLERLWPQLHLTSTAHVKASSLMRRRLTAALRNADRDVLLLMWGAHPLLDVSLESTWRAASPHWSEDRRALVGRKYAAALAGMDEPEFDDPDPIRGWAAQYLNVWPLLLSARGDGIFPQWDQLVTDDLMPPPAAFGVAADFDHVWFSVGAASGGEVPHLGPVSVVRDGEAVVLRVRQDQAEAFGLVAEIARLQKTYGGTVVIDPHGPAGEFIPTLRAADIDVTPAGLDERVQADGDLAQAVKTGSVTHRGYAELDAAVDAADWRRVNDRRVLGRKNGDVSMLEACSLALWGATYHPAYNLADSFG